MVRFQVLSQKGTGFDSSFDSINIGSSNNIYEYNVENLNNKWLHLVNTFSPDHIPRLWINNTEIMGNATITEHNDTTINDDEEDLVALKFGLCDAKDCAFSYDATGFIFVSGKWECN